MVSMRRRVLGPAIVAGCLGVGMSAMALGPWRAIAHDPPRAVAIHAGGGVVPANLLRVYVEFSVPMEAGWSDGKIHLVDDAGQEVAGALLHPAEELWSPDGRFLTVLFDPGRIKRGLKSNVEMGVPLVTGRRYRLVIDPGWYDSHGRVSVSAYAQELRVVGADRASPDPGQWSVTPPVRDSHDELRVDFGKPLDYALALRAIAVVDSAGSFVRGKAALSNGDHVWSFVPSRGWIGRRYALRVDPELEDLAGNNLDRPFDSDRSRDGVVAERAAVDRQPRFLRVILR